MPLSSALFPYTTLFRSVHAIDDVEVEVFRVDDAAFVAGHDVAVEAGRDLLVERGLRHEVARELLDGELVEWLVGVEGLDHAFRSEEHTSELQSHHDLVCRCRLHSFPTRRSSDLFTRSTT